MLTADLPTVEAVRVSFLAELPAALRGVIADRARLVRVPPGYTLVDDQRQFAGIVITGLLRVFGSYDSNHSITYRNVARGEAVGLAALVGVKDPICVQAVTASCILELDLRQMAELRTCEPALNLAIAREVLRRLRDTSRELEVWARGSVRQRAARQLLDLAAENGEAIPAVIRISHESLAEDIGSRREVVSRALSTLAAAGAIGLGRRSITIVDATALQSFVVAGDRRISS